MKRIIKIRNLDCAACAAELQEELAAIEGISEVSVDFVTQRVALCHEGEEAGLVVRGRLELTVGEEIHILDTGDSYYFESKLPHRFNNPFDEPCELVSATTPANF